jgi:hypothetical protein
MLVRVSTGGRGDQATSPGHGGWRLLRELVPKVIGVLSLVLNEAYSGASNDAEAARRASNLPARNHLLLEAARRGQAR